MTEIVYRDAVRNDHPAIVDFQVAMALETESVMLDRPTCSKGVAAVFENPALGRYFADQQPGSLHDWSVNPVPWGKVKGFVEEAAPSGCYLSAGPMLISRAHAGSSHGLGGLCR